MIINGDFYKELPKIRTGTIDLILTDLPYNMTGLKWDSKLDLREMWNLFHHVLKDNGVIILNASQPFTSELIMSNREEFKTEWIWKKNIGSNFATMKYQPFKEHESILVFGNNITYNPIKETRAKSGLSRAKSPFKWNTKTEHYGGNHGKYKKDKIDELRFPSSVQSINVERGLHPTQKPVKLCEYFIKTYSNERDTVLDVCAGSGTTGVACLNTNRNFILIEKEKKYYDIIKERLNA